jgi:hypothetical protein
VAAHEAQRVVKDVIGDAPALGDALGLVEAPVDAEVDAALAVFLLSLRERVEGAQDERAHRAVVGAGDAVVFIRDEGETDTIGAVKTPQRLEERAAKARVARWVGGPVPGSDSRMPVIGRQKS